ncbi:hypothetical protein AAFN47_26260 [Hoeflea sp. CAU 1731]
MAKRNFPLADPVLKNVNPNTLLQIQPVHPPPPARTKTRDLNVAGFYSGKTENPAGQFIGWLLHRILQRPLRAQ